MAGIRAALADSFSALGREISVTNPPGYCTGGESPAERELYRRAQVSLDENARIVHWAARCSELAELRSGRRELLDTWLQIQLLGRAGEFRPVEVSREKFVAGMAGSKPRLDVDAVNRRLARGFQDTSVRLDNVVFDVIGRDGNATFIVSRATLKVGQIERKVRGMGAVTLVNSVPMSLLVYEADGRSPGAEEIQRTLRALLQSVLTEN